MCPVARAARTHVPPEAPPVLTALFSSCRAARRPARQCPPFKIGVVQPHPGIQHIHHHSTRPAATICLAPRVVAVQPAAGVNSVETPGGEELEGGGGGVLVGARVGGGERGPLLGGGGGFLGGEDGYSLRGEGDDAVRSDARDEGRGEE